MQVAPIIVPQSVHGRETETTRGKHGPNIDNARVLYRQNANLTLVRGPNPHQAFGVLALGHCPSKALPASIAARRGRMFVGRAHQGSIRLRSPSGRDLSTCIGCNPTCPAGLSGALHPSLVPVLLSLQSLWLATATTPIVSHPLVSNLTFRATHVCCPIAPYNAPPPPAFPLLLILTSYYRGLAAKPCRNGWPLRAA